MKLYINSYHHASSEVDFCWHVYPKWICSHIRKHYPTPKNGRILLRFVLTSRRCIIVGRTLHSNRFERLNEDFSVSIGTCVLTHYYFLRRNWNSGNGNSVTWKISRCWANSWLYKNIYVIVFGIDILYVQCKNPCPKPVEFPLYWFISTIGNILADLTL